MQHTMKLFWLALGLVLVALRPVAADVTVATRLLLQYDRSPKIRIQGTGFTEEGKIRATFDPPIRDGKEYMLIKQDEDTLVLKLLTNQKCVLPPRTFLSHPNAHALTHTHAQVGRPH